jgi:hypothetical protein
MRPSPPPPWLASIWRRARGCSDAVRSWLAAVQIRRRARGNCSPKWLWLTAAHGGTRVASEGLDPHSHLHPLLVGGGGVGLTGPVFCRYGPARIRGLLDGPFHPHPLSHRNNTGTSVLRAARHALRGMDLTKDGDGGAGPTIVGGDKAKILGFG